MLVIALTLLYYVVKEAKIHLNSTNKNSHRVVLKIALLRGYYEVKSAAFCQMFTICTDNLTFLGVNNIESR